MHFSRRRLILSVITFILLGLTIYLLKDDLVVAWDLLLNANWAVLLLIIPLQALCYYGSGQQVFSYLRQGGDLQETSSLDTTKMSLELNFVNHVLPSAGVSGASYMTWRLQKEKVSTGRAAMAQVVSFATSFAGYLILLIVSVILITIDGSVSRFMLLTSSGLATLIICGSLFIIYILNSPDRLHGLLRFIASTVNYINKHIFRRKKIFWHPQKVTKFFEQIYDDYVILKRSPRILVQPLWWGMLSIVCNIAMFVVVFASLGSFVNPAQIFIAYGVATLAGAFLVTPGGAGGFEAIMIFILTTGGVPAGLAFAGVLLGRVLMLALTIASGYIFYQLALNKYDQDGKQPLKR